MKISLYRTCSDQHVVTAGTSDVSRPFRLRVSLAEPIREEEEEDEQFGVL